MTIYTARLRYHASGVEDTITEDSALALELKLIALAPYVTVLDRDVEARPDSPTKDADPK